MTGPLAGVDPGFHFVASELRVLERRIQEFDKLDVRKKCQIMQLLNTFIANEKLRQKVKTKQTA